MKIGVFAKTFRGTEPRSVLAASRAAGFEAVQYNMACSGLGALPAEISPAQARAVADAAAAEDVEIAALSATYNMTDPDLTRRTAGRIAFQAIAGQAKAMGTQVLTVCSGSRDPDDQWRRHPDNDSAEAWRDMCREFERLLPIAEAAGVVIGVEPEHANVVSNASKAVELLRSLAGSRIRIVLDPANLLDGVESAARNAVLRDAIERLGPHLVLAHAKDRAEDGSVAPAGNGVVDWPVFLAGLAAVGFDGPLIAHGMSAVEAPAVAKFLRAEVDRN
jgi:sugar phosphate isomerase/epimerase